MKNAFTMIVAVTLLVVAAAGCGGVNPFAGNGAADSAGGNKSTSGQSANSPAGNGNIGIPECDEVMAMLATYADSETDNFVTRAVKQAFINRIKDGINNSIEQNKGNRAQIASTCKEFKTQLVNYQTKGQPPPK